MNKEPIIHRFFGKETLHPAIPIMGRSIQKTARPGLQKHQHSFYEIVLLEKGRVNWFIEEKTLTMDTPSVFMTHPHQEHGSSHGVIQPSTFSWLQLDPQALPQELTELLTHCKWNHRPLDPQLVFIFHKLFEEILGPSSTSPIMVESLLTQFIVSLSRCQETQESQHSHAILKVVRAISKSPNHPWNRNELEKISGLKHSQLNQRFQEEMGTSPRAYAMGFRLREVHRRLREENCNMTVLAHEMGFNSSQHLASTFRKHFGVTPTQCRTEKGF